MGDRLALEHVSLRQLEDAVRELERRIAALEARVAEGAQPGGFDDAATAPASPLLAAVTGSTHAGDVAGTLSLAGRSLLVLGGAFILRALTDARALPLAAGVALGLAYSAGWLAMAFRAAPRHPASAAFHGAMALAIGVPLAWEATTRFALLSPLAGVLVLAAFSGGALAIAWHRRLRALAWMATAASLAGALSLLASTGEYVLLAQFTIALGVAALWLGYDREWYGLRWLVALPANVLVLAVTSRALRGAEEPSAALYAQVLLLAAYLGTIATRTLVRGRNVIPFEIAQTIVGLVVGLGGAVMVVRASGSGTQGLGTISMVLGAATYAVAFAFVDRRQGRGLNLYCYSTLALALMLVGGTLLFEPPLAAVLWSALAVSMAAAGRQFSRGALALHGAVYLVAATWTSGLLDHAATALGGSVAVAWVAAAPAGWLALLAAAVCVAVLPPPCADDWPRLGGVPRCTVGALLVVSAAGALVALLVPGLAGTPGAGADAGALATLRTTVLAAAAILVAWGGTHARFSGVAWLLYPLLVLTALKLVMEDVPRSRPATLFAALAAYGIALILAPRLAGRSAISRN